MPKRLINDANYLDVSTLSDYYLLVAINIEDALLEAGAVPKQDYGLKDLFELATPIVLNQWKDDHLDLKYRRGGLLGTC